MLFTEPIFLPFFALCFGVRWLMRGHGAQKTFLWLCSYVFYGAWDYRFLALIAFTTCVDYLVGKAIAGNDAPRRRRLLLLVSLTSNLGMLGTFKYFDFFVSSTTSLLGTFGIVVKPPGLHLVLPVGVSFFTFQSISYVMDIYRRKIEPVRSLRDYAMFVSFFPQLVAGPIVRAADFLPQLQSPRRLADVHFRLHLALFCLGYFKKVCVADNLASVIDPVFAAPKAYAASDILFAAFGYSVQIYCDFSGYTDMAIALAGLLGFQLCRNFDAPYLSRNIQDFWRRWHISLSTWLRDYLYVSMGGNRVGPVAVYRNLMWTMVLGGLWHGANFTFVLWGFLHGLALSAHRFASRAGWTKPLSRVPGSGVLAWALTLVWVVACFTLFRAESVGHFWNMLLGLGRVHREARLGAHYWYLLLGLSLSHVGWRMLRGRIQPLAARVPAPVYGFAIGLAVALALFLTPLANKPFIYFQF